MFRKHWKYLLKRKALKIPATTKLHLLIAWNLHEIIVLSLLIRNKRIQKKLVKEKKRRSTPKAKYELDRTYLPLFVHPYSFLVSQLSHNTHSPEFHTSPKNSKMESPISSSKLIHDVYRFSGGKLINPLQSLSWSINIFIPPTGKLLTSNPQNSWRSGFLLFCLRNLWSGVDTQKYIYHNFTREKVCFLFKTYIING